MSSQRTWQMANQQFQVDHLLWKTCLNCHHAEIRDNNHTGMCLKHAVIPPLEVIVVGCTDHFDHIPF